MYKKIILSLSFIAFVYCCKAQQLIVGNVTLQYNKSGHNYIGIKEHKAFTESEAMANKLIIDFALIAKKDGSRTSLQWLNMGGKENVIPEKLIGTQSLINAISLDLEQFNKCKTKQDFERITGHISKNSFSYFATITDNKENGILYPCFIIQFEDGTRALLWIRQITQEKFELIIKLNS